MGSDGHKHPQRNVQQAPEEGDERCVRESGTFQVSRERCSSVVSKVGPRLRLADHLQIGSLSYFVSRLPSTSQVVVRH